jgi:signal transduction histidine kinase
MNMLVSGAALLIACAGFIAYDAVTFRQAVVDSLSTQAKIVGSNCVSALLFDDPHSAAETLSTLRAAPNVTAAVILTPRGLPFASYGRGRKLALPPALVPGRTEMHRFQSGQVMLLRSIVFQGKTVGMVYIQSNLQALTARFERYLGISAIVLAASLLAAFPLSSLFRRSTSEPIANLAQIARTVSRDKNYSLRVLPPRHRDEVAVLIDAFNEMLSQIQARDAALQAAHSDLELRVRDRTAQLAAANKELEAFSYSVSHDLRAPLRGIDGFSQALLEDYAPVLDANGNDYLRRIRAATQRMAALIDDLLNLSRVTRTAMRCEPVDLTALAQSVAQELRNNQPDRRVEFQIAEGLTADADPRLLRVVMENLLGNAWKYTSRHDHARIEFGRCPRNGQAAYFVRDDGAGFDPRYAGRLFGAFQRLHGTTDFPGTGVGLATVQRILRRHGGDIWAEGAVERGATFYFTL